MRARDHDFHVHSAPFGLYQNLYRLFTDIIGNRLLFLLLPGKDLADIEAELWLFSRATYLDWHDGASILLFE